MQNCKGFDDWIEIFKGGSQIDNEGRVHDGDALIKAAVATFNTDVHEPPLVVGHPKHNAPAFGWITGLKTVLKNGTTVLLAKFKDVVPEFEELVKKGLYKNRSASFYRDGRLRHVGFLGAAPPAVQGLTAIRFTVNTQKNFGFSEDCSNTYYEFTNQMKGEIKMKFSDFLDAFRFWQKVQDDPNVELSEFKPSSDDSADFVEAKKDQEIGESIAAKVN